MSSQDRFCQVCGSRLSAYNSTKECFRHELPGYLRSREAVQKARENAPSCLAVSTQTPGVDADPNEAISSIETLDPRRVIKAVARHFGVAEELMYLPGRKQPLALARQLAMYLLRTECKYSFPEIGRVLGGRDHTTILYACRLIETELDKHKNVLEEIKRLLGSARG